jgi:flagellar hook-associated protein FlgK
MGEFMVESELEKAFSTLADVLTMTESEINEEINVIVQQIEQLKDRINELNDRQQTLAADRGSIAEMYRRYCAQEGAPVEF